MRDRIIGIEYLRGIAALSVALYHIIGQQAALFGPEGTLLPEYPGLWGVDLFFLISGFIIAHTTRQLPAGIAMAGKFLLRRLIRIVPAYWFFTIALLLVGLWIAPSTAIPWHDLVTSLLMIHVRGFPLLMVGWSLSYEMLFYLLFAVGLIGLTHRQRILLTCTVLLAAVIYGQLGYKLSPVGRFLFHPLLAEFVGGMLLQLAFARLPGFRHAWLILVAGILWLAFNSYHYNADDLLARRVILFGLPSLLMLAGTLFWTQLPQWPLLARAGTISYSVYLCHLPVALLTGAAIRQLPALLPGAITTLIFITLSLVLTLLLSTYSFRYVEHATGQWLRQKLLSAT